jgi:small subunit ribosomal protein S14
VAKTSLIEKSKRKPKFETRRHSRCLSCGRPRGYYRRFGLCRICLREDVHRGFVPGVVKASW